MEITEVRIKLVEGNKDKLKAFCSITIENSFVIRDLKVIEGTRGLFVAMPSRRLTSRCGKCGGKNQVRSNFCSECGYAMPPDRGAKGKQGRPKLHADIAHPINSHCREEIQAKVIESYQRELDASQQPGYEPPSFEEYNEPEEVLVGSEGEAVEPPPPPAPEQPRRREREAKPRHGSEVPEDNFGADLF